MAVEGSAAMASTRQRLVVAAVFVASVVAQLLRQSGIRSWQTVWAEDGRAFYGGTHGIRDLLEPHAGYMQLPGRTIGLVAHHVPIADVAIYYALAGAVVTSIAGLAVWCFAEELVPSAWLRAVLALQVVLLPVLLLEQVANGVNTIWAVLFAAWWALLYRPRRWLQVIAPATIVAVAAMSSGFAFAFLPVAVVLAWRRTWYARVVAIVFAAGCLVQAIVMLNATDDTVNGPHHLGDLAGVFSIRVLASMLMGEQWVDDGWKAFGWALAWLAAIAFVVLVVSLAWRTRDEHLVLAVVSIAYGIGLYVAAIWLRGTVMMRIPAVYNSIGNRWAALAIWLLVSGMVLLVAGNRSVVVAKWATVGVVVWFTVVSVAGFAGRNPRSDGPAWKPSVSAALAQCNAGHDPVQLAVVPYPFDVTISCADLRDAR
jgi:hypothetical protein